MTVPSVQTTGDIFVKGGTEGISAKLASLKIRLQTSEDEIATIKTEMASLLSTETDPQVGTVTQDKWCVGTSGGQVECTANQPLLSYTETRLTVGSSVGGFGIEPQELPPTFVVHQGRDTAPGILIFSRELPFMDASCNISSIEKNKVPDAPVAGVGRAGNRAEDIGPLASPARQYLTFELASKGNSGADCERPRHGAPKGTVRRRMRCDASARAAAYSNFQILQIPSGHKFYGRCSASAL